LIDELGNDLERLEMTDMEMQLIRALAAIDDALGIDPDGCNELERTLDAIAELKASAARGVELARTVMADNIGHA
jgi:hypothetical protein